MKIRDTRPVRWIARLSARLMEHQVGEQATVIAFNAIYAMFPLVLLLTAIVGSLVHGAAARDQLLRTVQDAFPEQLARELSDVINAAGTYSGLIGLVAFLSLLWAGSNLFTAIEVSFSRIFGVPARGIVQQRLVGVAMILVFSALLLLSVAAAHVPLLLAELYKGPGAARPGWGSGQILGLVGGWILATLLQLIIYLVIPNVRLPFRALWPGAVLAGTSLQTTTLVFPLYIRHFAGFNRFGDAFSLVFLVMTWFYFLAYILLVGAEVNALCFADVVARDHGR